MRNRSIVSVYAGNTRRQATADRSNLILEAEMRGMRRTYFAALAIVWCLNGWALLQQLSLVPGFQGFIAATLLINMLVAPLVLWVAFLYGELAEEETLRGKRRRTGTERHAR